ncbi:MAG: pyridoxal 5'-phosphate synthase glutaminase subunit PdxT [Euryarchaeota archaeon]|nr:pyridoxal 5'-phosphate synthase glutaminase subunit PdxT [Euryarchaeota archaeon]
MKIAVVSVQGAFAEHQDAVRAAARTIGARVDVLEARRPADVIEASGVIIPGGESTTISKLIDKAGIRDVLIRRANEEDLPIMGTCAGAILLANRGDDQVKRTDTKLLGLMDMAVDRNAFGRQRESFEADVRLKFLAKPFRAIFIRAPAILQTFRECKIDGFYTGVPIVRGSAADESDKRGEKGFIVAAREKNRLAFCFHPELTRDPRVHGHFLEIARSWEKR